MQSILAAEAFRVAGVARLIYFYCENVVTRSRSLLLLRACRPPRVSARALINSLFAENRENRILVQSLAQHRQIARVDTVKS